MQKTKKVVCLLGAVMLAAGMMAFPVCAKEANVAGVIEETWSSAAGQIKTVVDNVVFPAIDMILAVFFFGKLGTAYFDYRKHGQFDWAPPAILFVCLVLMLTAPMYGRYSESDKKGQGSGRCLYGILLRTRSWGRLRTGSMDRS